MKLTAKRIVWQGAFIRAFVLGYEDLSGGQREWEAVERINCNGIVAVVPVTTEGEILLVRQFRPVLDNFVIEFPAGLNDRRESLVEAARRELIEETGYTSERLSYLTEGPISSGISTEILTNREKGISLVELMIVTALLGLVMAGMYNMFVHQQKSYSVQDHVSAMQQNARAGLEYMVKDIRMAGYVPEGIPFDAFDPPLPTPQKPAPSADVAGQTFTDGDDEDIEEATATSITFQGDIDNDARTETVCYALNGTDLTMEVWEWNAATSSWGSSTGAQIIAEDIENLASTYVVLSDDYGVNKPTS